MVPEIYIYYTNIMYIHIIIIPGDAVIYCGYKGTYMCTYRVWPRPLWKCFQNDTVRMGTAAPGQARRRHDGEFDDAAQLPVVFHRFRTVCRMRSPTQVSANLNLPTTARVDILHYNIHNY